MSVERRKKAARPAPGIFADTGGWYALVDKSDPDHPQAKDWFRQNRMPLITTDYILDEALALIRTGLGPREAVEFGEKLLASRLARLIPVTKEDKERAWEIFKRYDDKVLSFTDCTSFAVMERLGIETAFTVDRDFKAQGYTAVP